MKQLKDNFSIFGFKFETKKAILVLGISIAVLLLLIALNVMGVEISWYGVLIGVAFLLAILLSSQLCESRGISKDFPMDLIWWVFPFSIIGARLYYVFCSLSEFTNFWNIFAIWKGGLGIYGGIIGGAIGLIICCIIKKVNILKCMDVVAPVLLLGQGIGRIGCYFAGCCCGVEITNPAFQWFPIAYFVHNGWHLATFFYECVLCIIGFFLLTNILRKNKDVGISTFVYLLYYGIVRFVLEFFRDASYRLDTIILNIPISIIVSAIAIIIGVVGLIYIFSRRNKNKINKINEKG